MFLDGQYAAFGKVTEGMEEALRIAGVRRDWNDRPKADERMKKLAKNLVAYSCAVQPGEKVLIEVFDCEDVVAEELVKAVYEAGGIPFVGAIPFFNSIPLLPETQKYF